MDENTKIMYEAAEPLYQKICVNAVAIPAERVFISD